MYTLHFPNIVLGEALKKEVILGHSCNNMHVVCNCTATCQCLLVCFSREVCPPTRRTYNGELFGYTSILTGLSYREISELLFVSENSVQRYVDSYKATGLVAPASQKHGPAKLLSDLEQKFLLESLIANPSTYLSELCEPLEEATGRVVYPSTICRTIKHFGMTRKKVRTIAMQRSEDRRAEFIAEVSQFDPDMLIWLDETGADRRNSIRAYGYAFSEV